MKSSPLGRFVLCLGVLSLASCSLTNADKRRSAASLPPGSRVEVRKALGKTETFRPSKQQQMSRYFVLLPEGSPRPMAAASRNGRDLQVRTTAYCHSESDHLVYGSLSAMGKPLRHGLVRSAAADWSRFPLGTQFRIKSQPGVVYEVDDYGSALVGTNTIDIYCPTEKSMDDWGVRHLDIEVLNWGSYSNSLALMKDRVAWPHVRHMVRSIHEKMGLRQTPAPSLSMTTPATATSAPTMLLAQGTSPSL